MTKFFAPLVLLFLAAVSHPALAEDGKLPPVSSVPETTTATFGDWTVRCIHADSSAKVCELQQTLTMKGQAAPVAEIAIGSANGHTVLTAVVPVNVSFSHPAGLGWSAPTPLSLTFRRCTPAGCFADGLLDTATLKTLGAETKPGRLLFTDAAERPVTLPMSFRGLAQAQADLQKEAAHH